MLVLVLIILILGVISFLAGLRRHHRLQEQIRRGELDAMPGIHQVTDCGAEECSLETTGTCAQSCERIRARLNYEYFDDEELDAFKGVEADAYSDEEAEQFREVLYTMPTGEVGDWTASLEARGIALPDVLKDEVFMIMEEERKYRKVAAEKA